MLENRLRLTGDFSFRTKDYTETKKTTAIPYSAYEGEIVYLGTPETDDVMKESLQLTTYIATNAYAEFEDTFAEKHYFKALAGYNYEQQDYKSTYSERNGLLMPDADNINFALGDVMSITAGGSRWRYVGAFFRFNYAYDDRYLLEVNGRYDGSSKFPNNSQWGFFPSASVGWRLSEEKFMGWSEGWLDNFKIRLSAGSMGNGNIDPYKYIDYMTLKSSTVVIGNALGTYTVAPGAIPLSLTWETSTTYDVGADLDLFKNRLTMGFDWYRRYTTDMYTVGVSLPAVYGTAAPKGNNASLKTNGWELSVGWRDSFRLAGKEFRYGVKAMVWDSRTWVTKYINPTGNLDDYYEGMELGEIWGYRVEGLFRDQDDIDSHATQSFLQSSDKVTRPGQVKFADLNEDGKIDQGAKTLSDHGDLTVIGNTSARYHYGINVNLNWNGIGISTFWQGVAKKNWYPRYDSGYFWGQYNRPFGYMLKAHTGSNVYSCLLYTSPSPRD